MGRLAFSYTCKVGAPLGVSMALDHACIAKRKFTQCIVSFLNFDTVFFTAMKMTKLRKAHYSPPLVGEDNSMVFTTHSVLFPATRDLRSPLAGNGNS